MWLIIFTLALCGFVAHFPTATWAVKWPKIYVTYTKVDCPAPNWELMKDYGCSLVPASDNTLMMNLHLISERDINNITLYFQLAVKERGKYVVHSRSEVDICLEFGQIHQNFMLRLFADEVRRVSNLPRNCPLKKNFEYFVHNMTIKSVVIPSFLPEVEWAVYSEYRTLSRRMFSLNTYGKLAKSPMKRN